MAEKKKLKVSKREVLGRKVKNLKKSGLVAANIYGHGVRSLAVQGDALVMKRLWEEAGETQVVYVEVEGEKGERPILIDEAQLSPLTRELTHLSFRQVNLKEKIEAEVAIVMVGENDVREAVVVQVHDNVMVEALPTDLPEEFEVDISELKEIDQGITFKDLKYDQSKVKLLIEDEEMDSMVVVLQAIKGEVAEETAVETEIAGEAPAEPIAA